MRFHIWIKTFVVTFSLSLCGIASAAMYTKSPTMPPASSVLSTGTPNLAANILEVGMQGVEFIPSTASESRAVATLSKGLSIPSSGIVSALKSGLKANAPSLLASGVIAGVVAGVGWIQGEGGQIQKPGTSTQPVATSPGQYRWCSDNTCELRDAISAAESCASIAKYLFPARGVGLVDRLQNNGTTASCYWADPNNSSNIQYYSTSRVGNGCPSNSSYDSSVGSCVGTGVPAPVTDEDMSVLDGFVQGKDGVWQQGLANEVCKSSSDFNACVANMGAKPYISGPATVSSPEVTTQTQTQNPDGTSTDVTTKTRTDYSLGYPSSSPGTITIDPKTVTTTTTTTKDANGVTTGSNTTTGSQTTTQPGEGTAIADGTFTDTPFPDPGPFYTQKYPDGFKGVWDNNKASFMQSDFIKFLEGFVPTFSGTCPTFGLSFSIMAHANYGYISFWSMCWIFDIIKTIMLVTAMFTCRALIFGG